MRSAPPRSRDGSTVTGCAPSVARPRTAQLRELPGIGPFSAELVWIRGVGDPDALPGNERRIEAIVRERYGDDARMEDVAEAWRPFRSWVALLLRASS